jgi:hypothetical protein
LTKSRILCVYYQVYYLFNVNARFDDKGFIITPGIGTESLKHIHDFVVGGEKHLPTYSESSFSLNNTKTGGSCQALHTPVMDHLVPLVSTQLPKFGPF